MEYSEMVSLFEKAQDKNNWGEWSSIVIYSDGSGEIAGGDDPYGIGETEIFEEFDSEEELIKILRK